VLRYFLMKVLQIVADGNPGGGTTFVLEMVRSLKEPILMTQKNSYALQAVSNAPSYGLDFFTSRMDPRTPKNMKKLIDEIKPDLIHVHGGRAAFFLSFIPKKCPVIYTVHGLHGIYQKLLFSKWAERRAIKASDLVVFVTKAEEDVALKNDLIRGKNHCVVQNGIDVSSFPTKKPAQEKQLAFIGRLCTQKDPLFLLKVMEILGPKGYQLKVIGGGEFEDEMRKSPYTSVTGKLPRDQALAELSGAEAILVPSNWEACGLVLLEAMALEIPIIASKLAPFEELAMPGPYATLIDEKDPQKYADAVLEKQDYTQAAKKHFDQNYTWDRCMNSYLAIYKELMQK